jgi:hypothetical protein
VSLGHLPGVYAVTTGVTDITFGITSYYMAGRRRGLVYWHALGVLAQIISGGLGILTSGTGWDYSPVALPAKP